MFGQVWSSMIRYGHVGCMVIYMYGHLWLLTVMYSNVWSFLVMYGHGHACPCMVNYIYVWSFMVMCVHLWSCMVMVMYCHIGCMVEYGSMVLYGHVKSNAGTMGNKGKL